MVKKIFNELNLLCVPTNLLGRDYIEYAVFLMIKKPNYKYKITIELYPKIASKFGVTKQCVERCIRHAVKKSFDNLDKEFVCQYFGYKKVKKITNSEFVSMVAKRILIDNQF